MAPPTSASAILSRSAVVLCGRQIVHAPAGVRRTIFCQSSRRTIAVGPWGYDSDAEVRTLLPRTAGRFGFFAAHPETHILSLHEHNLY